MLRARIDELTRRHYLGELVFTRYYRELHDRSGVSYSDRSWNALTDWERQSWIETARFIEQEAPFVVSPPK